MSAAGLDVRRPLRQAILAVCNRNDRLARAWYVHELRRAERHFDARPIIVYQMGKVGSTTVRLSLSASDVGRKVYQVHTLHPKLNESIEEQRREYPPEEREDALRRVWRNQYLYERLVSDKGGEPWKVITLVRDPIARNVGTFFQHVEILHEDDLAWHVRALSYDFELTVPKNDLRGLGKMFFERCRHDQALEFFDREFNGLWDIDVFAEPFPKERGFHTYRNRKMDVLLLRLEDLDRCGAEAMGGFLNCFNIRITKKNVGSAKPYADLYSRFKREIDLPTSYLDKMYGSKLAMHFYTLAELERFRARWSWKEGS